MELINDEKRTEIIETARSIMKDKNIVKITVRDILKAMNITNRVFYNRFRNIDEVLSILYEESVNRVRESLFAPWDGDGDFAEYIQSIAVRTLILSYESRQNMSQFIFETDSANSSNFEWWSKEIRQLISVGKEINYLRDDADEDAVAYSIWCFIRGFNADAVSRNMPVDEAVRLFRNGFGCFLNGIKK